MAGLNAVKDFSEYPVGAIDESAKKDRLEMYKDLLVAKWNYQQLDEEFMNTGQAQAFKNNRKLMKALDETIKKWDKKLHEVYGVVDIAEAEDKAMEEINRLQAEKEFIVVEDDLNENLDIEA